MRKGQQIYLAGLGRLFLAPFYHLISDEGIPHIQHLFRFPTIKEFRQDIDFFLRHYHPMDLPELIDYAKSGRPFPRQAFFLSFDDGLRECSEFVAPILLEKGVPATFFACSGFVDNPKLFYRHKASLLVDRLRTLNRPSAGDAIIKLIGNRPGESPQAINCLLSLGRDDEPLLDQAALLLEVDFQDYLKRKRPYLERAELQAMLTSGFRIGAHSIDHPRFSELSLAEQVHQAVTSVDTVAGWFNLPYKAFAFPHNCRNVPHQFFDQVLKRNRVDVSFGTDGLRRDDYYPRHSQRLCMEGNSRSALAKVGIECVKQGARKLLGRARLARPNA